MQFLWCGTFYWLVPEWAVNINAYVRYEHVYFYFPEVELKWTRHARRTRKLGILLSTSNKNKHLGSGNSIVLVANSHHMVEARSIWSWTRGSSGNTTALVVLPWITSELGTVLQHRGMFCPESKVSCDQFPYASVSFFITAIWFATQNLKLAELHCHFLAFSLAATFLPQFFLWTPFR